MNGVSWRMLGLELGGRKGVIRGAAGNYKSDPSQCPSGHSSTWCNYSSIIYSLFFFFFFKVLLQM